MADRFAGVPRGKPLRGTRAIAGHILADEDCWHSVYRLDRDAYGIKFIAGELLAFENWIEIALAAETGRKHRRKPAETAAATATKSTRLGCPPRHAVARRL